jgi:hypothetical protein
MRRSRLTPSPTSLPASRDVASSIEANDAVANSPVVIGASSRFTSTKATSGFQCYTGAHNKMTLPAIHGNLVLSEAE